MRSQCLHDVHPQTKVLRQEGTGLSRSSKDVLIAEVTLENYSKHMNLYKSVLGLLARRRR